MVVETVKPPKSPIKKADIIPQRDIPQPNINPRAKVEVMYLQELTPGNYRHIRSKVISVAAFDIMNQKDGRTYVIDSHFKLPWYNKRMQPIIPVNVNLGIPLIFEANKEGTPFMVALKSWASITMNKLYKQRLVEQIIAGSTKSLKTTSWRDWVPGIVLGFMMGAFLMLILVSNGVKV